MDRKPNASAEIDYNNHENEYGSQKSNRKVPADVLEDPYDKDGAIRAAIEAQDKAISERSGLPPLGIKSITRVK